MEELEKQIEEIIDKMNDPALCEGTASTYQRVTGYFRPVENWNRGKRAEYLERLEYRLD